MQTKEFFIEYYDIIKYIVGLIILALGLLIKSYLTEKGKLKALISENEKLVAQTETIKSHFNKELEELKKDHQLDISKRKYQYETKKDTYLNFFKLLDSFSNSQILSSQGKLKEYIDDFNRNYLNGQNQKKQNQATIVFSKRILNLSSESYKDFQKLRQETNTIRLTASDEVIKKLNFLDYCYEKTMEVSDKMMKSLPVLMISNDQNKMQQQQRELEINGKLLEKIKLELIELMREELNQI